MQRDDVRVAEARAMPIATIVELLALPSLSHAGHALVGPCPKCGGKDRFSVHLLKGVFQCRRCEIKGDGIALVMAVRGIDFPDALTLLCGAVTEIGQEERERRLARARKAQAEVDARADRERQKAVADARRIWKDGQRCEGTAVEAYLRRRAIDMVALGGWPPCLRFHPDLPYAHHIDGGYRTIHRGPAMLAAIQGRDGRFAAVHRTYLDLAQPKGKAVILHPGTGEALDAKKGLGSKKGGTIRLSGFRTADTLIMAEGIETTLSAWMANPASPAMFWAGVDLGNMGGKRQRGPGLSHAGLPDLEDARAFLPPRGLARLVYVQDGDSDPRDTRATLQAGLRRAMAHDPGLRGQIVRAPDGKDLNDVLMGDQ